MSEVLRNPPVLKKLQDELERVVGMGVWYVNLIFLRLVYLQAVVKETLRLHPPGLLPFPTYLWRTALCWAMKSPETLAFW
jgi:cytochrome P450